MFHEFLGVFTGNMFIVYFPLNTPFFSFPYLVLLRQPILDNLSPYVLISERDEALVNNNRLFIINVDLL